MKNIVLIGMAGSGKTTIGKLLSKKTGLTFIDMDQTIQDEENMTIAEIVGQFGWGYFRNLEKKLVKKLAGQDNLIIATGGGVVLRENNINNLKRKGRVSWLKTPTATIIERVKKDTTRPIFSNKKTIKKDIEKLYQDRFEIYKKAAHRIIETEEKKVDELVLQILASINVGC